MSAIPHTLTLPAPAKLNRMLHIVGRRPDGYHELQTLFQFKFAKPIALRICHYVKNGINGGITRLGITFGIEGLAIMHDTIIRT